MNNSVAKNLTNVRPVDRVAAIIITNNKILLMYRINQGKKYYTFPGGGIDSGESKEEAMARECKEETSIDIQVDRLLYELNWDHKTKQFFYLCQYIKGTPVLGDFNEKEAMKDGNQYYEPMWVKIDKLTSLLLYPLEIRDWIIRDLMKGWPKSAQSMRLSLATCRQEI